MANEVLEYINTATAVAAFLISADLTATLQNVREYFRSHPSALSAQFEQPDEIAFVRALVIDRELLEALSDDVTGAIMAERDCLKRSSTPQEKDACGRRAEKRVCDSLNRIRDRNEDSLPTDFLNRRWRSYRCARA